MRCLDFFLSLACSGSHVDRDELLVASDRNGMFNPQAAE